MWASGRPEQWWRLLNPSGAHHIQGKDFHAGHDSGIGHGIASDGLASGDFRPTGQQAEVQKVLEERLRITLSQRDGLLSKDLSGFNDRLRKKNVLNIIAKTP